MAQPASETSPSFGAPSLPRQPMMTQAKNAAVVCIGRKEQRLGTQTCEKGCCACGGIGLRALPSQQQGDCDVPQQKAATDLRWRAQTLKDEVELFVHRPALKEHLACAVV